MRKIIYIIVITAFALWALVSSVIEYKINRILEDLSNDKIKISYQKIIVGFGFRELISTTLKGATVKRIYPDKVEIYNLGDLNAIFYPFERKCQMELKDNHYIDFDKKAFDLKTDPSINVTINLEEGILYRLIKKKRMVRSIIVPRVLLSFLKENVVINELNLSADLHFIEKESELNVDANLLLETKEESFSCAGTIGFRLRDNKKSYYFAFVRPALKSTFMHENILTLYGDVEFFRDKFPFGTLSVTIPDINKLTHSAFIESTLAPRLEKILYKIRDKKYGKNAHNLENIDFTINFTEEGVKIENIELENLKGRK